MCVCVCVCVSVVLLSPQPGTAAPGQAGLRVCSSKAPCQPAGEDSPCCHCSLKDPLPYRPSGSNKTHSITDNIHWDEGVM